MQRLGRSRSSINAAFASCGWVGRPFSEEEQWRSALQQAIPHFSFDPSDLRQWTIRGNDGSSGCDVKMWEPANEIQEEEGKPADWKTKRIKLPSCEHLNSRFQCQTVD
jgi:hypothetical protein